MGELVFLIILLSFLLDQAHLGLLCPGCKHSGKPLRQGHGIRNQCWSRGQQQLLLFIPGKSTGNWRRIEGERDEHDEHDGNDDSRHIWHKLETVVDRTWRLQLERGNLNEYRWG